ncbi:MAG: pyridoxamine 5'-phosphate oxidase family protein [Methanospirillum sp.]|nr:pyridoxamine 5'-phosphate oxidase family protein [Methanospirillum sp.]
MVALTPDIEESLRETKTAFLATSSGDGCPNVVPIAAFTVLDNGSLLISDQFFNKTLKNMQQNPRIALSWWGGKGGFQVKGTVTLHTDDEVFSRNVAWMKEFRPNLVPKTAVLVTVTDVYTVVPGDEPGKKIL